MTNSHGRRRRLSCLLITSSAVVGLSCAQPTPEDHLNMACVSRLRLPFYPPIAHSARFGGTMTTAISLAKGGSVQSIALENISGPSPDVAEKVFRPEIERAMGASQFAAACDGRTVRLTFVFEINGRPPTSVWFDFPNRFEIAAPEAPIINTRSE